jgi:O-antigen polymerase
MNLTRIIPSAVLLILLAVVLVLLPSVVHEPFMNATQTGKILFFLLALLVILLVDAIVFISVPSPRHFIFTRLDLIVSAWFVYLIADGIIRGTPWSLSLAEFAGLALFYVLLRLIPLKHFKWLFFAFITGGIIQAVYGNLQLWGYYPSYHNLFKLTGSFFNPGPYAGFLSVVFPVALGFWLFGIKLVNPRKKIESAPGKITKVLQTGLDVTIHWFNKTGIKAQKTGIKELCTKMLNKAGYYLPVVAMISIVLVLPASRSRAAWLAVSGAAVYLFAVKYRWIQKLKRLNFSAGKKALMVFLVIAMTVAGAAGLYRLKKGSADGRMLIWKITTRMIADHPVTGTGFNGFKANYMENQARYFENNTDSEEARVAGDTNYAFNELLQQTAEHGLSGTVLLALIFIAAFSVSKSDRKHDRKSDSMTPSHAITVFDTTNLKSEGMTQSHAITHSAVIISKALLLSFLIFSLFSYPVQILPVKTGMALALAFLSGSSRKISLGRPANKINRQVTVFMAKVLVGGVALATVYFGAGFLEKQTGALKNWKYAFTLYGMGVYEQSIAEYEKALPVLQRNGDFLTNYGKALSMAGKHEEAITTLKKAAEYYPNTVVYTALGDSHKATGENKKAETAYLHAWHMNPARFYPKYLLAKLYDETGQKVKAAKVARELLEKEIKVESTAIDEIKAEMQKIINK